MSEGNRCTLRVFPGLTRQAICVLYDKSDLPCPRLQLHIGSGADADGSEQVQEISGDDPHRCEHYVGEESLIRVAVAPSADSTAQEVRVTYDVQLLGRILPTKEGSPPVIWYDGQPTIRVRWTTDHCVSLERIQPAIGQGEVFLLEPIEFLVATTALPAEVTTTTAEQELRAALPQPEPVQKVQLPYSGSRLYTDTPLVTRWEQTVFVGSRTLVEVRAPRAKIEWSLHQEPELERRVVRS